jgi:hypothetical protein
MSSVTRYLTVILVLLLGGLALTLAPPAQAANPSAGNQAQLITAINTVNGAGAGTHTIRLTADITLTAALPALTNSAAVEVVFDGNGHTLTGDGAHTILKIDPGVTARVRDVTLTRGAGDSGPAGEQGGGIYNRGRLTVEDTRLYQNSASGGGAIYNHGGAGNTADLVLTRVLIESNGDGGGQNGGGAGVAAVADGGTASVAISQSIFKSNFATAGGGGIFLNGGGGEARLTMDTTAIIFNGTMGGGGGLAIISNGGVVAALLVNSTVVENDSDFNGGGIAITENGGTAELGLVFSTVNSNTMSLTGSAIFNAGGAITTVASIIGASGYTPACAVDGGGAFALTSSGYNLGDDGSCDLDAATDKPSGQPQTAFAQPVAATYGQTYVAPIDALSDAQQAIPTGVLGCGTTVAQDQRGQPRPNPAPRCDIGAYESDAVTICTSSLTAADEVELEFAVDCFNAAGAGTHTVTLTADFALTKLITPLNNTAATELIIDGDGHTIDGGGNGPMLWIESDTTARVRDVTLVNGENAILNGGRLTVESSRLTNNRGQLGAAIQTYGDLNVVGSTFTDNEARYGAAVALHTQGITTTITIRDSVMSSNTAEVQGGALYIFSSNSSTATVSLSGVTVEGNESPNGGGGVDLIAGQDSELTATITRSRITDNEGYRGGLMVLAVEGGVAEATVTNSAVDGNRSSAQGGLTESAAGGIYVSARSGGTTSLTLFNSTVSGNTTGRAGGGLLVVGQGGAVGANVVYSTLAGNTSGTGGGGIHTLAGEGGTAAVTLAATIITNGDGAGPDCARPSGAIISTGFNLAGDGTCFGNAQASDLPVANALLLPLALNAPGSTPTHALNVASPARDRIPRGGQGCGTAITTDQRGAPRPSPAGGRCDIGAFEAEPAPVVEYKLYLPALRRE